VVQHFRQLIGEGPVAVVDIHPVRNGIVVRKVNVRPAVAVDVGNTAAQTIRKGRGVQTCGFGDILEMPAVIPEQL